MSKKIDMTNYEFDNWVVKNLSHSDKREHRQYRYFWNCECKLCGEKKVIDGRKIRMGRKWLCNCQRKRLKPIIGTRICYWDVLQEREQFYETCNEIFCLCRCKCGTERWVRKLSLINGESKSCGCKNKFLKGEANKAFRQNTKSSGGYAYLYKPDHRNCNSRGRILEHKFVMSEYLGRPLEDKETVHHINGNKLDNRIENLELWASNHAPGQRAEDLVAYAREILETYKNYQNPTVLTSKEQIAPDWFELEK